MAAEVGEQCGERRVVMLVEQGRSVPAELRLDSGPPCGSALVMQRRQLGVGQLLEPIAQRLVPVERGGETLAVAQLDHPPAARTENLVEPLEHPVGAGRVETLAV